MLRARPAPVERTPKTFRFSIHWPDFESLSPTLARRVEWPFILAALREVRRYTAGVRLRPARAGAPRRRLRVVS